MQRFGLQVRSGLHTGEVETISDKVGGSLLRSEPGSRPKPVLPKYSSLRQSRTWSQAPDFHFEDAGEHELKGVPDRWRLYRVVSEAV